MFTSYVSFGNSITAGFQSGGINDSTQREAYPVLLAAQMGTAFAIPSLNYPGCPPPLLNAFTQTPIAVAPLGGCGLRRTPLPIAINNVAVPGARLVDGLTNLSPAGGANGLTTIILGGRTQFEAARAVHPTFVTVWLGNNDALGAALAGDTTLLTDPATFAAEYTATLDSITTLNVQGAVLIGVANVVQIPALTSGAAYFAAKAAGSLPASLTVSATCGPSSGGGVGDATLVPFEYGFGELVAQAQAGQPATLNCATDLAVLAKAELQAVVRNVAAYNATIQAEAAKRGWAYLDPNPALDSLRVAGRVPAFPNAPPSTLAEAQPFGPFFSRDGVHPNAATHKLIANHIIDAINAAYKATLAHVQ
jgi:lysophospholipase L1-like esterase